MAYLDKIAMFHALYYTTFINGSKQLYKSDIVRVSRYGALSNTLAFF